MTPVSVTRGAGPVVLGLPHTGTHLPADILTRLNARGRTLSDTDWHVDRLYHGLLPGATMVRATFHRYVIDANRDPTGTSLYPGQNTTGLCPVTDFDGADIYEPNAAPGADEVSERSRRFHQPYHAALRAEMTRVHALHGVAVLYDCHSIRSVIPYLFAGNLPDFNIGTNDGTSCAKSIETAAKKICEGAEGYSSIVNGRFKGGWTTREYGRPAEGWHAVQMELAQITHLAEETLPFRYDAVKADALRVHLKHVLEAIENEAFKMGAMR